MISNRFLQEEGETSGSKVLQCMLVSLHSELDIQRYMMKIESSQRALRRPINKEPQGRVGEAEVWRAGRLLPPSPRWPRGREKEAEEQDDELEERNSRSFYNLSPVAGP
ncbi:hypothetical protein DV515_00001439 [Chloebia gouldiae]|uniref:Uncharacterized protein n=1 Tax=Chloebia gouldiae TaxID=44316 RepID=A0A3L8SYR9_CHLGU|nr:hypothetical protein DV515_00001439 [Chloebia gouldiae]